jgi:hypothetical protein
MVTPLLTDEYIASRIGPNPLEAYMKEFQRHLEKMSTGACQWHCSFCGQYGRGFSDVMSGSFKCFGCFFNEEYERVSNDAVMVKKVRLWNLRAARERHKMKEELEANMILNLTNDAKEVVAQKIYSNVEKTIDPSYL